MVELRPPFWYFSRKAGHASRCHARSRPQSDPGHLEFEQTPMTDGRRCCTTSKVFEKSTDLMKQRTLQTHDTHIQDFKFQDCRLHRPLRGGLVRSEKLFGRLCVFAALVCVKFDYRYVSMHTLSLCWMQLCFSPDVSMPLSHSGAHPP